MFADSGVGAGIDSYYEYLMKAYILLGDSVFLERFNVVGLPQTIQLCIILQQYLWLHQYPLLSIAFSAKVFRKRLFNLSHFILS